MVKKYTHINKNNTILLIKNQAIKKNSLSPHIDLLALLLIPLHIYISKSNYVAVTTFVIRRNNCYHLQLKNLASKP